jgi:hypothetical protein
MDGFGVLRIKVAQMRKSPRPRRRRLQAPRQPPSDLKAYTRTPVVERPR